MMLLLTQEQKIKIKQLAVKAYPQEGCGIIESGVVAAIQNIAEDPLNNFEMPAGTVATHEIEAIWHSHADGPQEPSDVDMEVQIETAVPWILCCSYSDGSASEPFMWGGEYIPPLIGREFRHGPSGTDGKGDCYALIKDWYLQECGVTLPEFPRANAWWETQPSMYLDHFKEAGFVDAEGEPQAGDVAFMQINAPVINHAAVYIGNGFLLQHFTNRLSRRDPAAMWQKMIKKWVRYNATGKS